MTIKEFEQYKVEADKLMKKHNGHYFETILKTRCRWCGRSSKIQTRCGSWFQTYLAKLTEVLAKNGVIDA